MVPVGQSIGITVDTLVVGGDITLSSASSLNLSSSASSSVVISGTIPCRLIGQRTFNTEFDIVLQVASSWQRTRRWSSVDRLQMLLRSPWQAA